MENTMETQTLTLLKYRVTIGPINNPTVSVPVEIAAAGLKTHLLFLV